MRRKVFIAALAQKKGQDKKKKRHGIINSNMLGKTTHKSERVSCSVSGQLLIHSNHSHIL